LVWIKTDKKEEFGLSYEAGCLKLALLCDGICSDEFAIRIGFIEQVWYRVIINMSPTETQCIIGSQTYRAKPLIKKER
jgi:hypothetical protein